MNYLEAIVLYSEPKTNRSTGSNYYKIYFPTEDGSVAWVNSKDKYEPGAVIRLVSASLPSSESAFNQRATLRIKERSAE